MKMQEFTFMKGEGQVKKYIMVIDEGTTGTRALLFDKDFNIVSQSYEEFTQYTPSEDKVEHDAMEIYDKTIDMCKKAMAQAGAAPEEISGIGITNQRATTVIWDKETGIPLCKAIVWQDNRTADRCAQINDSEWGKKCKQAIGWTVAPVYSSLMVEWLMKNNEEVNRKLRDGSALFGTIDTWLVWKLTGGKRHTISYSNVSVNGALNNLLVNTEEETLLSAPEFLPELCADKRRNVVGIWTPPLCAEYNTLAHSTDSQKAADQKALQERIYANSLAAIKEASFGTLLVCDPFAYKALQEYGYPKGKMVYYLDVIR